MSGLLPLSLPAASAAEEDAPSVSLTLAAGSGVVAPGQDLAVTATVANRGTTALQAGTLVLGLTPDEADRGGLEKQLTDPGSAETAAAGSVPVPALPPGASVAVSATVPAGDVARILTGADWGAHVVTGNLEVGGTSVAFGASGLVWQNGAAPPPVGVALVMPLTTPGISAGLLDAESLDAYTSTGGVLRKKLDAVRGTPTAIAVDPRIVASIRALGSTAPASAVAWLNDLRDSSNYIFPLGYADADPSLERAAGAPRSSRRGRSRPRWTPPTSREPRQGSPRFNADADPDPRADRERDTRAGARGGADDGCTARLGLLGHGHRVADQDDAGRPALLRRVGTDPVARAEQRAGRLGIAPSGGRGARGQHGARGRLRAVGLPVVRRLLGGGGGWTRRGGGRDRTPRGVGGQGSRGVDRRGRPRSGVAGGHREHDVRAERGPLAALGRPGAAGRCADRGSELALRGDQPADPRAPTASQLVQDDGAIASFSSILERPELLTGRERLRLLAILSSQWQELPDAWQTAATDLHSRFLGILGSVSLTSTSVFVVSPDAEVPISVRNDLDFPVTIRLDGRPSNGRILVEGATATVDAQSSQRVGLPTRSIVNGRVTLTVTAFSPTGVQVGSPAVITLDVQAEWEAVGTGVVVGLVVALFGFGIFRNIRRRRRAAAEARE
ncbi:hypothetical protein GCM10025866_12690 [Naasia aerilata]|uniref:Uncharacterized protein n=1 Tax=Naasia aerilata TaxID=1162966 RepID=A0ABN6XP61_9MICO|nr:hypothetical protein GCM10025866_12690 [Naasia aerilata]